MRPIWNFETKTQFNPSTLIIPGNTVPGNNNSAGLLLPSTARYYYYGKTNVARQQISKTIRYFALPISRYLVLRQRLHLEESKAHSLVTATVIVWPPSCRVESYFYFSEGG